jgi:hypothetical protein
LFFQSDTCVSSDQVASYFDIVPGSIRGKGTLADWIVFDDDIIAHMYFQCLQSVLATIVPAGDLYLSNVLRFAEVYLPPSPLVIARM